MASILQGSETHRGGKAKEALSCRIGLHSSRFHGTPPSAGPGGILPAASGSGGKERARRNSGTEKLGDNHAPGYIDRAFECCSSPRAAVRIARQCQSPRARCRSVQWVEPCYAQEPQEASEPGTPGCPKTPMHSQTPALIQEILLSPGGDASPTAVALFQKHFTASPGFAQNWSPSRGQSSPSLGAGCRSSRRDKSRLGCPSAPGHLDDPASPTAVALFQQYFAPSPGFFNQAQKLLAGDSTPASPGGFAKAQRRPVLGPRYCIQPMNSPLSEAGTPTAGDPSPFIFRSASKSEAQDESPFIFRSACKSVAGGHAVQFADGESSTTPSPQEDRPRVRGSECADPLGSVEGLGHAPETLWTRRVGVTCLGTAEAQQQLLILAAIIRLVISPPLNLPAGTRHEPWGHLMDSHRHCWFTLFLMGWPPVHAPQIHSAGEAIARAILCRLHSYRL